MNIVPSIELIPAKYGVGTLLTQVPMDVSGDFSVTRATAVSTRYNSAGLIETIASGIPRLDYYTSSGTPGCPALLVEPSAANLAFNSAQFDDAYWSKSSLNTSGSWVNVATAPDGTMTADKMIPNSVNTAHSINRTGFASAAYTLSVFAKADGESIISLWLRGNTVRAEFNLVSGTVSNITVTSARIENYGNGWYRCSVYDSTAGTTIGIYGRAGGGFQGNDVDGVLLWGAQLETGSVATSYIPTTTGSVTRDADVINKTGVSGLIGQTEGTMYAEFEYKTNIAERRLIALSNGTASDRIMLWTLNNILYAQVEAGSIILASPITEGYHKVAFAYQQSGVSGTLFASLDGGGVVSGTSAAFPASLTDINIGKNEATATSTFFWNARIRSVAIYKTRLPNYLLESATSQIQSYSALASSLSYTVV
jgi:hypothetical protein